MGLQTHQKYPFFPLCSERFGRKFFENRCKKKSPRAHIFLLLLLLLPQRQLWATFKGSERKEQDSPVLHACLQERESWERENEDICITRRRNNITTTRQRVDGMRISGEERERDVQRGRRASELSDLRRGRGWKLQASRRRGNEEAREISQIVCSRREGEKKSCR